MVGNSSWVECINIFLRTMRTARLTQPSDLLLRYLLKTLRSWTILIVVNGMRCNLNKGSRQQPHGAI